MAAFGVGWLLLVGCGLPKTTISPGDDAPQDQWSRGVWLYGQQCAGCHGENGEGDEETPALAGEGALAKLGTAAELFAFAKENMPPLAPGSLSDEEYYAVTAYVLKQAEVKFDGDVTASTAGSISLR